MHAAMMFTLCHDITMLSLIADMPRCFSLLMLCWPYAALLLPLLMLLHARQPRFRRRRHYA